MTIKTSISLTDQQAAFARKLVEEGRYASLSAVLQQGLEMMRRDEEAFEAEKEAFRQMILRRAKGPFVSAEEMNRRVEAMLTEESRRLGLED